MGLENSKTDLMFSAKDIADMHFNVYPEVLEQELHDGATSELATDDGITTDSIDRPPYLELLDILNEEPHQPTGTEEIRSDNGTSN